jgi:hypothetical protein
MGSRRAGKVILTLAHVRAAVQRLLEKREPSAHYPIFLPPELYDRAQVMGFDMRPFQRMKRLPKWEDRE